MIIIYSVCHPYMHAYIHAFLPVGVNMYPGPVGEEEKRVAYNSIIICLKISEKGKY